MTTPALPADGDYRVVVAGSAGDSVPNGSVDVVTALRPGTVAVVAGQVGKRHRHQGAARGLRLRHHASEPAFAARNVRRDRAALGQATALAWIDDSHVWITVPAATAGTTAPIVVCRTGVPGPRSTSAPATAAGR